MAMLAAFGCLFMAGCSRDQAVVSLEGDCEYSAGFDPARLKDSDNRPWTRFRAPGSFSSIQTFRRSPATVTLRWTIPQSICETALHGGSIALRSGRAGDRVRFFINDCAVTAPGADTPSIVNVDRERIFDVPPSCFRPGTGPNNRLFAVYEYVDNMEFHGVRVPGAIGDAGEVYRDYFTEMIVSFFLLGGVLVIAFYYIILGLLRTKDLYNFYFGLVALSFLFFLSSNSLIREVFFPSSILEGKVDLCSGICMDLFMLLFVTRLITPRRQPAVVWYAVVFGFLAFVSIFVNADFMHDIRLVWYLSTVFLVPYIGIFTLVHAIRGSFEARVVLAGILVFIVSGLHDLFAFLGYVPFAFTMPYAFILFIIILIVLLSRKFVSVHNSMEVLNAVLEQRVESRTAELELSNKQKDKMISVIAHDLNNPITAINITSSLMDISTKNREYKSLAEYTAIIKQACTQAMNTIADVLRQARQRETDSVDVGQTVDLVTFLSALYRQYQVRAGEKGVDMVYNDKAPPVFVHINTSGFTRVMDNILSNALKFTPANGRVEMTVEATDETARVAVKDSGIGIPDEIRDTVFERFTSAGRKGTNLENSTGLGLSIARDIVEKHKGRIWFTSVKGQGTTFFVEIPRIPAATSPA
jgi:signal transduction histidine kinase